MSEKRVVTSIWISDIRKQKSHLVTPKHKIEVSEDGQIWITNYNKPVHKTDGNVSVTLATGGRCNISVNSIILQAFSETIPTNMQIKHLDGDKTNCAVSNMSFVEDFSDIELKVSKLRTASEYTYEEVIDLCNKGIEVWVQANKLYLRVNKTTSKEFIVKSNVEVSNMGNIRVLRYNDWSLVIDGKSTKKTDHLRTKLACTCGESISFMRHQIIMQSFFPNDIPELLLIDHIDRNPLNNKISNLRWASFKENSNNKGNQIDLAIQKRIAYLEQLLNENNISFN